MLDPDEVAAAVDLGLPVIAGDKPLFALPCPKLVGSCCSIYGDRPRVCGRYKCQLLQDVEGGVLALDDARRKVVTAKQLAERFLAAAPPGTTLPGARAYAAEPAGPASGDLEPRLHATALQLYLDKHFRNSRDGPLLHATVVKQGTRETDMA